MKANLDLKTNKLELDGEPAEIAEFVGIVTLSTDAQASAGRHGSRHSAETGIAIPGGMAPAILSQSPVDESRALKGNKSVTTKSGTTAKRYSNRSLISDEDRDKITELHHAGKGIEEIAATLGLKWKLVYDRVYRLKKKEGKKGRTKTTSRGRRSSFGKQDELISMYKAGKTPPEMADALGIETKTVYNWLYRLDKQGKIKYQPKKPQLAKGKKAKAVSAWTKEDDAKLRELAQPPSEYLSKMAQLLKRSEDDVAARLKALGLNAAAG